MIQLWNMIAAIIFKETPKEEPQPLPPLTHVKWTKGENFRLSEHFMSNEFDCNCSYNTCVEQTISKELIEKLTDVRRAINCPLYVTSGFRCADYQAKLSDYGLETARGQSQHELGNAADLLPFNASPDKMVKLGELLEKAFMAVGTAKQFYHVDTRADKVRRWRYLK